MLDEIDGLISAGARPEVYLSITHGVLLPSALARIDRDDRIKRVVISDTIYQPPAIREHQKITIVSVAELLARVIGRIHAGESISSLLNKQ